MRLGHTPRIYTSLRKAAAFVLLFSFLISPLHTLAAKPTERTVSSEQKQQDTATPQISKVVIQKEPDQAPQALIPQESTMSSSVAAEDTINPYVQTYHETIDLDRSSNSATGDFAYEVPIVVPPGRNNMEPSLSLNYSSRSGSEDDIYGYGWNLSIPYIERMNKSGLEDLYSTSTPYFYSSFSGELATTSATTTAYVARVDDGSYLSYSFVGNVWTAVDQKGTTYIFGETSGARRDNPSDSSQVQRWMLEKIIDSNGNAVKYEYFKDAGTIYPDIIRYTNTATSTGIFSVQFARSLRATSTATSSAVGFPSTVRYKIDSIATYINANWVRKYDLAYSAGTNGTRLMLGSVTESGRAENGTTASLPPTTFTYSSQSRQWEKSTEWDIPFVFSNGANDQGVRVADINGDGLPDLVQSLLDNSNGTTISKNILINNGEDGWDGIPLTTWNPPCYFTELQGNNKQFDKGGRLIDVDGDQLTDFVCGSSIYLNTGNGWALSSTWTNPEEIADTFKKDAGTRFADINGDGLVDIVRSYYYNPNNIPHSYTRRVHINNGSGWTLAPSWQVPAVFSAFLDRDYGSRIADINGDGLADIIGSENPAGSSENMIFINTGSGWATSTDWSTPFPIEGGSVRLEDFNGDGLPDIGVGSYMYPQIPYPEAWSENSIFVNTGKNWELDPTFDLPIPFDLNVADTGTYVLDVNGDGSQDFVTRGSGSAVRYWERNEINFGSGHTDRLVSVKTPEGGKIDAAYKSSHEFEMQGGQSANATLPIILMTVESVRKTDPAGTNQQEVFTYEGGQFKKFSPFDRLFTGFEAVERTDGEGNTTKTLYHQGNLSNIAEDEYDDHRAKVGKPYVIEMRDDSGDLYLRTMNKWERANRGGDANFVYLGQKIDMEYDGDSDHADTAETYAYNTSAGTLSLKTQWGAVNGNINGTFTDTGSDRYITAYTYATSTSGALILPSRELTTSQASSTVRDTKTYYDALAFGSVTKGNPTMQEAWVVGTTTINTEKAYNSLGLVVSEKDPRDKASTYTYDAYALYPEAKIINALKRSWHEYDYSSGKETKFEDWNRNKFYTTYDPLDRPLTETKPNPASPLTQITSRTYTYSDSVFPQRTKTSTYLDATSTVDVYTYTDGFGRKREERTEAEGANTFSVKQVKYDGNGRVAYESLPYFGSGTAFTGTTSPAVANLRIQNEYDPLGRISKVENVLGSTESEYDDWKTTITDSNGNVRNTEQDAYGNLVKVTEHLGASSYNTLYEYDGNNNLTKSTDADGNVRNFTYDALGRRLTAQDLHDAGDATYGTWTYKYDEAGNLTERIDPKNQTVRWAYDNLNRPTYENYVAGSGIEIDYQYDGCTLGKNFLCAATSTSGASMGRTFDVHGNMLTESRILDGTTYLTQYQYDLQGNRTKVIYPDGSELAYAYNNAGKLESLSYKPSGGSYAPLVTDIDYAPNGQISYKAFANGVESTYTFAQNQLYRLQRIQTIRPETQSMMMAQQKSGYSSPEEQILAMLGMTDAPIFGLEAMEETVSESVPDVVEVEEPAAEIEPVIDTVPPTVPEIPEAPATTSVPVLPDPAPIQESLSTTTETTAIETVATTTPFSNYLLSLPDSAPDLKLKAPKEKHLGFKATSDGLVKYAYRSDISVESIPASEETVRKLSENGLAVGSEAVEKRTKFSRTFSTNEKGVYVTEIVAGDPQYYKDPNGKWWLAEYGVTTQKAFDKQVKEDKKSLVDSLVSLLVPARAYAAESTFYPDPNTEVTTVDGEAYKDNDTNWSALRSAASSNWSGDGNSTYNILDQVGNGNGTSFYGIRRIFLLYDTSSLPDDANIRDASIQMYAGTMTLNSGSSQKVYVVSSNPNSNTAITTADFGSVGSVALGENDGSITTGTYEAMVFNSTGRTHIDRTGISKFALRTSNDFNNVVPNNTTEVALNFYASETNGTSQDPKLVVIYAMDPTVPSSLLTEGAANPQTVLDRTPEFSAVFNDGDAIDYAGSYRIQVSSTTSFAATVWDSGKTAFGSTTSATSTPVGMRSPDISYAGAFLASSTPYYWRVKFWDQTDIESPWSTENASFSLSNWVPPSEPTALQTDGQTNPATIADPLPEFSAIFADEDAGDHAMYYQVQVATSSSYWLQPVWDSGQSQLASSTVSGTRISPVGYEGPILPPNATYYWRIRLWDSYDLVSPWSTTTASFGVPVPEPGSLIQNIQYAYDDVGNITSISDQSDTLAGKVLAFTYDDLYRLTSASTTAASSTPFKETYAYSPIGNLLSKTGQGTYAYAETGYINPHAPTSIASTTLSYDNNGNLTRYGARTNVWNYANKITATGAAGATTTFAYDEAGQRFKKASASTTSYYVNNEYDVTGSKKTRHIYDSLGGLLATVETTGSTTSFFYYHPDHLGGMNVMTDEDADVVELTDYYPYGSERVSVGPHDEAKTYIGQEYDEESQFTYLNARYYEGSRGQFLSQDPVFWEIGQTSDGKTAMMDPQLMNSYSYAGNNPVTHKDATGRSRTSALGHMYTSLSMMPADVSRQAYQAITAGFALPAVTLMAPGTAAMATEAVATSPALAGATLNVAVRATTDLQSGQTSSAEQYAGSAAFGAATAQLSLGKGVLGTMGIAGASSAGEGYLVDGSVSIPQVVGNTLGAGAGKLFGKTAAEAAPTYLASPASQAFVENATAYTTTAVTTKALTPKNTKNK